MNFAYRAQRPGPGKRVNRVHICKPDLLMKSVGKLGKQFVSPQPLHKVIDSSQ